MVIASRNRGDYEDTISVIAEGLLKWLIRFAQGSRGGRGRAHLGRHLGDHFSLRQASDKLPSWS